MPRGHVPNRWLVDGKWMTRKELAEEIGITPNALWCAAKRHGVSLPVAFEMYRSGQIVAGKPGTPRHKVHGCWLSVKEAADACGVSADYMNAWRRRRGLTLEQAYDHFTEVRRNPEAYPMGRIPRRYWVLGHQMTIKEAAARYRLAEQSIRRYSYRHHCSVNTAVKALTRRREDEAVKAIVATVMGVR